MSSFLCYLALAYALLSGIVTIAGLALIVKQYFFPTPRKTKQ
jgi:hypothetical protein